MSYASMGEAAISMRVDWSKAMIDLKHGQEDLKKKLIEIENTIIAKAGEKSGKTFFQRMFSTGAGDVIKGLGIFTGLYQITRAVKNTVSASIRSFADFEFEMASVKAKANASASEFMLLEKAARNMGKTTYYSAIEAAQGLKILVEMGLNAREAVQALPQVITLATTEGMNLADAADIALGSMRGMALTTADLSRIVDGLAYVSAKSASTVYSLGQGLKVAGAAAHLSGQSLEDVLAVLGGLSNQMIRNETAGFAVTQMMARLTRAASNLKSAVDETGSTIGQARKTIRDLDLDLTKGGKTLRTLPELFVELRNKGLTTLEALKIFGVYTYKYALAAVNAADATQKLKDELVKVGGEAVGAGKRMADIKLDTLKGDIKLAHNSLIELGITIGDIFSPVMRGAVQAFTATIRELVNVLSTYSPKQKSVFDKPFVKGVPQEGTESMKGVVNTEDELLRQYLENSKKRSESWKQFIKDFADNILGRNSVSYTNEMDFKIIDKDAIDKAYSDIMTKVRLIKYNEFGLPFVEAEQTKLFSESSMNQERVLNDKLRTASEAEEKLMKELYSKEKVMSLDNLKFQLAQLEEQKNTAIDLVNARYDAEKEKITSVEKFRQEREGVNEEATKELMDELMAKEKERASKLSQIQALIGQLTTEQISKFAQSNTKGRLEEQNKTEQHNARLAEAYVRLASGMKATSTDYFKWKVRALEEQKQKELAIVGETEEGKYLVEASFAEQRKQLHYEEMERLGDLVDGMKLSVLKLQDVGMELGKMGEDFADSLRSGVTSDLSNFFESIADTTKSWKDKMIDLFKSLSDTLLKITSQLLAELLVKWAIMKFFGGMSSSFNSQSTSTNAGGSSSWGLGSTGGNYEGFFNTQNTSPNISAKSMSTSNNKNKNMSTQSSEPLIVNQNIEFKIDATDRNSFRRMLKTDGATIQEITRDAVRRSMGYASEIRGKKG